MDSQPEHGTGVVCHTEKQWTKGTGGPGRIFLGCSSRRPPTCAKVTLFDLVPDGVGTVAIERHGAPPMRLRVRGNVYVVRLDARPRSRLRPTHVVYDRPGLGRVRQRVHLPG
jgi:hypothetical protein